LTVWRFQDHPRQPCGPRGGDRRTLLVDKLTTLAVEARISTCIRTGDDGAAIRALAEEVAPALRESVTSERAAVGAVS
jgi:hypothetical protein